MPRPDPLGLRKDRYRTAGPLLQAALDAYYQDVNDRFDRLLTTAEHCPNDFAVSLRLRDR